MENICEIAIRRSVKMIRSLSMYASRKHSLIAWFACLASTIPMTAIAQELSRYEIGLSMYSLRQLFHSGELHAHDYPDFAKETFGISKIDVWDGGYPKGWRRDPEFLPELKRRADAAGAEIFLVMTGTVDATVESEGDLRKSGLEFTDAVDQALLLGSDYARVFLKVDAKLPADESIRRAIIALTALADYAGDKGITVAIEPSPGPTASGAYLAKLVERMNHAHCKLMPDFGKMRGTDIYRGTKEMMPHTVVVSAKAHEIGKDGAPEEFDYPQLMQIVRRSGFEGIVAIEYEGARLGPVEGVKAVQQTLESCNQ